MADPILEKLRGMTWHYGDKDPVALSALEARIFSAAQKRQLLTYSDLARGITFHLSTLREPQRTIDVTEWQDLDRAIIGDFLGFISLRSYEKNGFLASALIVSKADGSPSEGFYTLLRELGLISGGKTDKAMYLWADHVARAHTWASKSSRTT